MSSNTVDFLLTTKDLQTVKQRTMNVSSVTYYKKVFDDMLFKLPN